MPARLSAAKRFFRTVVLGVKSLWLHRLRSLLTMLGIVFGVCSVIAMLAVGEGASREAQEQIRQLGSTTVILRSVKPAEEENTTSERSFVIEYGLTYADLEALRSVIEDIDSVVPARVIREPVFRHSRRTDARLIGTVPEYMEAKGVRMVAGRFVHPTDVEIGANVAVLDRVTESVLFPFGGALGETIRVGTNYYRIIGVSETSQPGDAMSPGSGAASGRLIYIPLTTARDRFGELLVSRSSGSREASRIELHEAVVDIRDTTRVLPVASAIRAILAARHPKSDYEVVVPLELLRNAERTKQIFNLVLGSIAGISLLVGGIGIMNIMLASVTERTREIGIRRALGARRSDIISQFLVETVLLSATGGVAGVILGLLIPALITQFAGMRTIVTPDGPIVALTISAAVGVLFGLYPAMRAAQMDPVEALRHD